MKISGVGLPFSIHQSSCSNRKPTNFEWSEGEEQIQVWMDLAVPYGVKHAESFTDNFTSRYAWFCESRAIVPHLQQAFENEAILEELLGVYKGIFTCDRELVAKHEKIHFCFAGSNLPWTPEKDYKIYDKTRLISFLASSKRVCYGHEMRHRLYEKIKERTSKESAIDVYGSITGKPFGHKPGCWLEGYPGNVWHDKSEALNDYMFSIVMENDIYDSYFTEKITDCFATGTIPVYYGSKSIGDYFNTDGIIFLEDDVDMMYNTISQLSPAMYYNRMNDIKENLENVKNMKSADDMMYEKIKEINYDTCNSL